MYVPCRPHSYLPLYPCSSASLERLNNTIILQLSSTLSSLTLPPAEVLDDLRTLERKTGLVFTLLKASVYSIVLQQEVSYGNPDLGQSQGTGREGPGGFGFGTASGGPNVQNGGDDEDGSEGTG
jgi:DASH complex subunit Dad3